MPLNRLTCPGHRGGEVDDQQHGHDDGKGIEQHVHDGGVLGDLERHQQQPTRRQDARIAKAGGHPGGGEEDQPVRVADVRHREGAERRHDRAIGQPQQNPPAPKRPLDSG